MDERDDFDMFLDELVNDANTEKRSKEAKNIELYEEIQSVINKLNLSELSHEREKAKCIYDYIVETVEFDYDHKPVKGIEQEAETAYAALVLKRGVCRAYTNATILLLDGAGIEAEERVETLYTRSGDEVEHSFVEACVDKEKINIEPTFGRMELEKGRNPDKYFDADEDVILERLERNKGIECEM